MSKDENKFLFHWLLAIAAGFAVRVLWEHSIYSHPKSNCSGDLLLDSIDKSNSSHQWLYVEKYKGGKAGVARTLQAMRALVRKSAGDVRIRSAAHSIVSSCAGHQFNCEIENIFRFTRDRITYRRDPAGWEWVQGPAETLGLGFGDCDDKSVLLSSLLAALGHRSRFVVIGQQSTNYSHVYVEAWNGRQWIALDPTNEHAPAGWQARSMARAVYEIF